MMTDIGPGREQVPLAPWERDAFTLIIEYNTRAPERLQLSDALKKISGSKGIHVIDGFHRNARKMWRTNIGIK